MKVRDGVQLPLTVLASAAVTIIVAFMWRAFGVDLAVAGGLGDWIAGSTSIMVQAVIVFYLIKTYNSQKKELEEQRRLLDLAHQESQRKRFEDGFYQLLARYESVVQGLVLPGNDTYRARRIFIGAADECMSFLDSVDHMKMTKEFFDSRDWWLGDWIRAIFMLAKYIRESDRTEDEQYNYMKIFRGFVSAPESRLLLLYLTTKDKGESETARYLLRKQFFKYSFISREKRYKQLDKTITELHGYTIYHDSDIPTHDRD
ncbi:MAG: hypothetical protein JSS89_05280 [Bacteroidetes bacterium]|nr:hypothetical protein [Bacteroidota bacterium]